MERRVLLDAFSRPPSLVLIEGESGIGKTRLLNDALQDPWTQNRLVLTGRCRYLSEPFPLGPLVDTLKAAASDLPQNLTAVATTAALRPLLPELEDRLAPPLDPAGDPGVEWHRVFRGIRDLFAQVGPAILVLDDVHWADDRTIDFLRYLANDIPPHLTVVIAYRAEDLAERVFTPAELTRADSSALIAHVRLLPLAVGDVRNLVATILGAPSVSEEFAEYMTERTGGLPFAIEEVLRLLLDRQDLMNRSGRWERRSIDCFEVPPAVRDSIAARLERLPDDARRVIETVAISRALLDLPMLQNILGFEAAKLERALESGMRAGFLVPVDHTAYQFRHALAQQSVHDLVAPTIRRRLHRGIAAVLQTEEDEPVLHLAHHLREAGDERWTSYAEDAGDLARTRHDERTACELYKDVLSVSTLSTKARIRVGTKLGDAALQGLAHNEAIPLLRTILTEEGLTKVARGRLRFWLGLLLTQAGDASQGYVEMERSLPDIATDYALTTRAMMELAMPWVADRHLDDHVAWLTKAVARVSKINDPTLRMKLVVNQVWMQLYLGDGRAWRLLDQILKEPFSAATELERTRGCLAVAITAVYNGHHGQARRLLDRSEITLKRFPSDRLERALSSARFELACREGRWRGLFEHAQRLAEEAKDVPGLWIDGNILMAELLMPRGRVKEAVALAEQIVPLALQDASFLDSAKAWRILCRAYVALDDVSRGEASAKAALDLMRRKGIWTWSADVLPWVVRAMLAAHRRKAAEAVVEEAEGWFADRDLPAGRAAILQARALVTDNEIERLRYLDETLALLDDMPRPYDAALVDELAGASLLEAGSPDGLERMQGALDRFNLLDADWDAQRVKRVLRNHGVVVPHRRGRKGYGDRLSPREAEVVRLAITGLTNREIAQHLFVSPRTVDSHMMRAMQKMGVSSRREFSRRKLERAAAEPPVPRSSEAEAAAADEVVPAADLVLLDGARKKIQ